MSAQRFDAREVLQSYVATLNSSREGVIRDAAELDYPKDIVRVVLQHCIKTIADADKRSFLKQAYVGLGNFQELSEEERKAVALLSNVGAPGSPGTDLYKEQASRLGDVADTLQAVLERLRAETAVLEQELESMSAEPEEESQQPAAMSPRGETVS
jgi:hypothetical protein